MNRRVALTNETKFYLGNGLELPNEQTPSIVSNRYFWTRIMENVFFTRNQTQGHVCTATCGRVVRMQIGSKRNARMKESKSEELNEVIRGFEEMIGLYACQSLGELEIKGMGVLFTPCARKLEILDSAVYLRSNARN